MKYTVKVKPRSNKRQVIRQDDGSLIVRVTAPPVEGKANEEVIELLSAYFQVPKRNISICTGAGGKTKIVEVL